MIRKLLAASAVALSPGLCAAQVVLTTSLFMPQTHPIAKGVFKWCDEVAAATAKRVSCKVLPKPVAAPPATFDAVRDGLADISVGVHGYTPGRFVLTQIAEFPFLGDSAEATSVAYQRIYERHLAALQEHKGVRVLTMFTHGPGDIYLAKRAINSAADLAGLKFRVGGGMVNDVGRAIGANVLLKPVTESYELLSSGVVDGVFLPAESIVVHRLETFVKYRTRVPGGLYNTSFAFVMNEDTWKRITPADQQAIGKLSGEHAAHLIGKEWDVADRRAIQQMESHQVSSAPSPAAFVDDVRAKTQPLEHKWTEAAQQRGLKDAAKTLQEFRSEIAKVKPL
ncbi:MAG: TRAP transporter substrate-binding protein [Ideonella sp.]|nr:TRAP transporter substrate-binding protein [Ideonella sp.]MCC7456621.1 TRAP transporter substrate-binding protein [Nitrospira sp.]